MAERQRGNREEVTKLEYEAQMFKLLPSFLYHIHYF
jgi:hypothetical protein